MTDQPAESAQTSYYALRPTTPVRAWLLTGLGLALGGLAMWVGLPEPRRIVLIIAGVILLIVALILAVVAASFTSSRTTHVVLSDEGFEVSGPGYHKAGDWRDVSAVAATPDGARLVITQGHVDRTFIQAPGGAVDDRMRALTDEIAERLNRRAR